MTCALPCDEPVDTLRWSRDDTWFIGVGIGGNYVVTPSQWTGFDGPINIWTAQAPDSSYIYQGISTPAPATQACEDHYRKWLQW